MTATNWPACFAETEKYEGWHQFSNDPYDPGGATWSGITQAAYDSYRANIKMPLQTVRKADDGEVRHIAKDQYWDAVRGDDLFRGLDLVLFDIAFNSGPIKAIKFLQQAVGVSIDGHFGLETSGALARISKKADLIHLICSERASFWHSLTTWWRFGRGWSSRGHGIEEKALQMSNQASEGLVA